MPKTNSTNSIVMIRPAQFGQNPQTLEDNAFQGESTLTSEQVHSHALEEFDQMAAALKAADVHVIVVQDSLDPHKPDAIFPNNWFSTHPDGRVILYPIKPANRKLEKLNPVIPTLDETFNITQITDYSEDSESLEGTGSIIFDHQNKIAYANRSLRTNASQLSKVCELLDYKPFLFEAKDQNGMDIYHTNVIMSVASEFVVICLEAVTEKAELKELIESTGKGVINISYNQVNNFCGNVLEVQNNRGEKILVMSTTAKNSFTAEQLSVIQQSCKILSFDVTTIQNYGGGGTRCMMAENFLPLK